MINRKATKPFQPHPFVRHRAVQSIVSTFLKTDEQLIRSIERPILIDAGQDQTDCEPDQPVRLLGYYTPQQTETSSRGLVLLMHGWEGCSHSTYNLSIANTLIQTGYDVLRLNVRDHGPGYHLNPYQLNKGIFLGTLLDEVATAVYQISEMAHDKPFYIVGLSMGGNFALRLAAFCHPLQPFHNLHGLIAVNPAIQIAHTMTALDRQPIYRLYFRRRWLRSLFEKQQFFPELYDMTPLKEIPLLWDMTDWLVERHSDYKNSADYFSRYSVPYDAFGNLTVPTTIMTAQDDPLVPHVDFYALKPHPLLDIQIHPYGGHVGFIDLFPFGHRLPAMIVEQLTDFERSSPT